MVCDRLVAGPASVHRFIDRCGHYLVPLVLAGMAFDILDKSRAGTLLMPPGAAEKVNFGPELMEFLEMDFDKLTPKAPGPPAL